VWEREKNAARFERKENTYFGKVLISYFVQFSRLWIGLGLNEIENGISKIFCIPQRAFVSPEFSIKLFHSKY
jgi:hypothetical protein